MAQAPAKHPNQAMNNATQSMAKQGQMPGVNPLMPWNMEQLTANGRARKAISSQGKWMRQPVASGSFVPVAGSGYVLNIPPQAIGLTVRYIMDMTCTVTTAAGGALTRQQFGAAAMCSNIMYQNPSQYTPINTTGWHVYSVMCLREKLVCGSCFTTDTPTGFGSLAGLQPISAPATIAASSSGTVRMQYEIPLAYQPELGNFQGAVFAGTTLSNQNLSFTFNPNFAVTNATADAGFSVYQASGNVLPTYSVTWTLYQEYIDQFDVSLISALTPDLSTGYYLSQQPFTGIVAGQDNQIPFGNLRTFMSLVLGYDQAGTYNAGTDINYFALVSANQLPFWKRTPAQQSWITRREIHADFPQGFYGFSFRKKPIATQAQGNTVLNVNPITAAALTTVYAGWEYLAVQSVLAGAPTLGA